MSVQDQVIQELRVKPEINPEEEIAHRVHFLKEYLKESGAYGYVLGISGGQDSTLAGKLAQMAVDALNKEEDRIVAFFHAVHLPYGKQRDWNDAVTAAEWIGADETFTVDIQHAVDASYMSFLAQTRIRLNAFLKGNIKARERMKVQYDLAGYHGMLVVGTDHAAEAITGFYTKHGDGACDVAPLFGLNKRQGRQLLRYLNCPPHLYYKTPTADLEDTKPGLPDEEALGLCYDSIDDYLEGKSVPEEDKNRIEELHWRTRHKRALPVTPARRL